MTRLTATEGPRRTVECMAAEVRGGEKATRGRVIVRSSSVSVTILRIIRRVSSEHISPQSSDIGGGGGLRGRNRWSLTQQVGVLGVLETRRQTRPCPRAWVPPLSRTRTGWDRETRSREHRGCIARFGERRPTNPPQNSLEFLRTVSSREPSSARGTRRGPRLRSVGRYASKDALASTLAVGCFSPGR